MNDPIVDEVHRIRDEYAARFNYDLWAMFRDLKEKERLSGRTYVSFADERQAALTPAAPIATTPDATALPTPPTADANR